MGIEPGTIGLAHQFSTTEIPRIRGRRLANNSSELQKRSLADVTSSASLLPESADVVIIETKEKLASHVNQIRKESDRDSGVTSTDKKSCVRRGSIRDKNARQEKQTRTNDIIVIPANL
uniref:(California timema) hypothetical protein n=1 Tax=Timema californicum TaxID=61474 RepID=A0A7R9J5E9_TIMCA|nr:unnamed protein product [Timema californicum]